MPKLPDIEYNVTVQGPPNVAQAFNSLADGMSAFGEVAHQAFMAYAEEQAKTQVSEASLILESGLADAEAKLRKPYLTPAEVTSAFPGGVPPELQTILERHQDKDAPSVPTHEVGAAIHAEVGKNLQENARGLIYSPKARAEFERRAESESLQRNIRVNQAMLEQGAELNAAKDVSLAEARARSAQTPGDWAKVYTAIETSGWLSPAQKEKYAAHFAGLQATQGKQRDAATIAEGALATGRDGITPWVDAGKAQAAFEKGIEGQDPLVAEGARSRFTQALEQNIAARKAADAPALGRLEQRLELGRGFSELDPDYLALSDQGKGVAAKMARTARRESKGASADARREQAAINQEAKDLFSGMTVQEKARVTDAEIREMYPHASRGTRAVIQGRRNDAVKEWNKDRGLGVEQRADLMRTEMAPLSYSDTQKKRVIERVEAKLTKLGKDTPPTNDDVMAELANQVLMGTTPGFVYGTNEEARWRAEVDGRPFTPLPSDKQPPAVQNIIRRATALAAASAPASPPAAPVAGQPKKGDQVGGAMVGRPKTEVWEYTGETNPQTGKPKLKRVK